MFCQSAARQGMQLKLWSDLELVQEMVAERGVGVSEDSKPI